MLLQRWGPMMLQTDNPRTELRIRDKIESTHCKSSTGNGQTDIRRFSAAIEVKSVLASILRH